jgi:hypothetical protein
MQFLWKYKDPITNWAAIIWGIVISPEVVILKPFAYEWWVAIVRTIIPMIGLYFIGKPNQPAQVKLDFTELKSSDQVSATGGQ